MEKKLYRSREQRVLAGIMGGLGTFFSIDPVLLRLGYLILTVFTGFVPGIVGYVLAIFIIPEEPRMTPSEPMAKKPETAKDDTATV